MDCASDDLLHDFAERALDARTSEFVRGHLIACHHCRRRFAVVRSQVEAMRSLRTGSVRGADRALIEDPDWFRHLRDACVRDAQVVAEERATGRDALAGGEAPGSRLSATPRARILGSGALLRWAPVAAALLIGLALGQWSGQPVAPANGPGTSGGALEMMAPGEAEGPAGTSGSARGSRGTPSAWDETAFPFERTRVVRMDRRLSGLPDVHSQSGLAGRPGAAGLESIGLGSLAPGSASKESSGTATPVSQAKPDPTPKTPNQR